ncbi:hypothetical protein ACFQJ8_04375 [Halocatena marina]
MAAWGYVGDRGTAAMAAARDFLFLQAHPDDAPERLSSGRADYDEVALPCSAFA